MKIDNELEIPWEEQCKFCTKGINTTYCYRNNVFMERLIEFVKNDFHKGDVEFKCEYFSFDHYKYDNK